MAYVVLARKWRPQKFSELVGQESIVKTLQNAIELERVSHAVLLTGSRGVGKTTTARILAKALNCEKAKSAEPCGECSNCKEIASGTCVDVLEVDGASNTKVDEIRDLLENVQYRPQKSRHKIYIIDEVHMLSTHSFNALLKTLEEPPPGVMFIFATTEPHKIPETIHSRCQRFDFRQISDEQMIEHLKKIVSVEKIQISISALAMVARQAQGGLRDALSLLDQMIAFSGNNIRDEDVTSVLGLTDRSLVKKTLEAFVSHDSVSVLDAVTRVFEKGFDPKTYVSDIWESVRDMILLKTGVSRAALRVTDVDLPMLTSLAERVDALELERWFDLLKITLIDIQRALFPRYIVEVAFLKIARPIPRIPIPELIDRLESMEKRLGPTGGVSSAVRTTAAVVPSVSPQTTAPATNLAVSSVSLDGLIVEVKKRKPAWAAILLQAAQSTIQNGALELTYDEGSFYEARANDKDFQTFLSDLSKELFGQPLTARVKTKPKSAVATPQGEDRTRQKEALENPVIQKAVSFFEARIEEVKTIK